MKVIIGLGLLALILTGILLSPAGNPFTAEAPATQEFKENPHYALANQTPVADDEVPGSDCD